VASPRPLGRPTAAEGVAPTLATVSDRYVTALAVVVVLVLISRVVVPSFPLARWSGPMTGLEAILFGVGSAGLVLHCWAMFFPGQVRPIPGGHAVIRVVDPLGTSSILWYAIGAAAIIAGLQGQRRLVQAGAAAGLAAVGYTMYDGGRLDTHLTAIFCTVVLLAVILAVLVVAPWRRRGSRGTAAIPPRSMA
jgi:hypothetical protein